MPFRRITPIILLVLLGLFVFLRGKEPNAPQAETDVLKVQKQWASYMDKVGAEKAYKDFVTTYASLPFGTQHPLSHVIGELLYQKHGSKGVGLCDASFNYGCYHSFFTAAISDKGPSIVQELNTRCKKAYQEKSTGCQHGIGHGLLAYFGRGKLKEALDACKTTGQSHPLFGCSGGVFMEYNNSFHFATKNAVVDTRKFNPENPYFPCNTVVPKEFRASCYFEIGLWWKQVLNSNYEKIGMLCGELSQAENEACFLGIGSVVAPDANYEANGIKTLCHRIGKEGESICVAGAAQTFITSEQKKSLPVLCNDIADSWKNTCMQNDPPAGRAGLVQ